MCTFENCTSLEYANYKVPNNVEDLSQLFSNCTDLKEANLVLSYNIKNMRQTFYYSNNSEKGPDIIPVNVENLTQTFQGCTKLHGEMTIKASQIEYNLCFAFVGQANESYRLIIKDWENNKEVLDKIIINGVSFLIHYDHALTFSFISISYYSNISHAESMVPPFLLKFSVFISTFVLSSTIGTI